MNHLYAIDRLIHKPVRLTGNYTGHPLQPWQKIVYQDEEGHEMVGEYLGYETDAEKTGTFLYPLLGQQEQNFEAYQQKAAGLFEIFDSQFKALFPESVPLCARMNLTWNHIYFYFYAETRFNFSDFVKSFREQIGCKFFLYQVGARDRVRLHPNLKEWFDPSGLPLLYSIFKHPLPTVDSEAIAVQNLEGRNPDRLKDRSGKLDHSLNFEKDLYAEEIKQYPPRWSIIDRYGVPMKCMGFNILTQEIKLRAVIDNDPQKFGGERKKVTLHEYQDALTHSSPTSQHD